MEFPTDHASEDEEEDAEVIREYYTKYGFYPLQMRDIDNKGMRCNLKIIMRMQNQCI